MKTTTREVTVTVQKVIQVNIKDECLTEEALREFSNDMFEVTDPNELFMHAADRIARFEDCEFVEGLGAVGTGHQYALTYRVLDEEITVEVPDQ